MGYVVQGVSKFYNVWKVGANVSRLPCDNVSVGIVGVYGLWLWVLIVCAIMVGCKACDLVSALGNVLEELFRYEGEVLC